MQSKGQPKAETEVTLRKVSSHWKLKALTEELEAPSSLKAIKATTNLQPSLVPEYTNSNSHR
jgi:hypothetical protein